MSAGAGIRVGLAAVSLAGLAWAGPPVLAADEPEPAGPLVQPGEQVWTETGGCTLSFVFDGAAGTAQEGGVYVSLAAHCVDDVGMGEEARLSDGDLIGRVAAVGDSWTAEDDWAFVQVEPAMLGRVSAAVKGHPTFPTGYTVASETRTGDRVQTSGYPVVAEHSRVARERRQSVLTTDTDSRAGTIGPLWWGDSGGPLVHVRTGKALGLASRLCIAPPRPCEAVHPTIEGVLARARNAGFHVTLRTV